MLLLASSDAGAGTMQTQLAQRFALPLLLGHHVFCVEESTQHAVSRHVKVMHCANMIQGPKAGC